MRPRGARIKTIQNADKNDTKKLLRKISGGGRVANGLLPLAVSRSGGGPSESLNDYARQFFRNIQDKANIAFITPTEYQKG